MTPIHAGVAFLAALSLETLTAAAPSAADLTVGVTLSASGAAAAPGAAARDALALLPDTIGGLRVRYLVLDDGGDPAAAARNARALADEAVDVIISSNATPAALAVLDVAARTATPMITLASGKGVVADVDERRRWAFKTPQDDDLMAAAVADHMRAGGVRTVAFIGTADAHGESWWGVFSTLATHRDLEVVAKVHYTASAAALDGQIATILAARPDAVLVAASGAAAARPARELARRGYAGLVYHSQGAATSAFLRAGGEEIEGALVPVGPAVVARQLPNGHPSKRAALEFLDRYEAATGAGSADAAAAAHAWDAYLLLRAAVPVAARQAPPGSRAFREALRTALEGVRGLPATHGVFDVTPTNHQGFDRRARLMARVERGAWRVAREEGEGSR